MVDTETPAGQPAPEHANARGAQVNRATPAIDDANSRPSALAEIDELVEAWFHDHFPGSAVARDTLAWNVVHKATEELKRRLADLRD